MYTVPMLAENWFANIHLSKKNYCVDYIYIRFFFTFFLQEKIKNELLTIVSDFLFAFHKYKFPGFLTSLANWTLLFIYLRQDPNASFGIQ